MEVWNICIGRLAPTLTAVFCFHQTIATIMMKTALLATIGAAVTSAQLLDISGLLAGLGPAPDGDSRFTTFTPAGPNDGKHANISSISIRGECKLIDHSVRSPCPGLVRACSTGP